MNFATIKQGINKYLIAPLLHTHTHTHKLENISIISSNCIGGVLSHDYKLKFMSPTVNLFMLPNDYIKFVKNIRHYIQCDVTEITNTNAPYPLGKLDDITLFFVHYPSFEFARAKWNERKQRIHFENLFLVFTDQNGCSEENVKEFSKFPYPKVFFTSQKKYAKYDFAVYMDSEKYSKKHNGRTLVDDACIFKGFSGKRNYEYIVDIMKYM